MDMNMVKGKYYPRLYLIDMGPRLKALLPEIGFFHDSPRDGVMC